MDSIKESVDVGSYPSIRSQPGSSSRNVQYISDVLESLLDEKSRIFEIGSHPYDHITEFASRYPKVQWSGSCRDDEEIKDVQKRFSSDSSEIPPNLSMPYKLDIAHLEDWTDCQTQIISALPKSKGIPPAAFTGVLLINVIHCLPEGLVGEVFKQFSPLQPGGRKMLDTDDGWIGAYGPWLNDEGEYKSQADEDFDIDHIRAKDPRLGLRSIASITEIARKWGFKEEKRIDMAQGNTFVVWRTDRPTW